MCDFWWLYCQVFVVSITLLKLLWWKNRKNKFWIIRSDFSFLQGKFASRANFKALTPLCNKGKLCLSLRPVIYAWTLSNVYVLKVLNTKLYNANFFKFSLKSCDISSLRAAYAVHEFEVKVRNIWLFSLPSLFLCSFSLSFSNHFF